MEDGFTVEGVVDDVEEEYDDGGEGVIEPHPSEEREETKEDTFVRTVTIAENCSLLIGQLERGGK